MLSKSEGPTVRTPDPKVRALVPVSAAIPVLDIAVLQSDDDFEISLPVVAFAKAHFTNSIAGAEDRALIPLTGCLVEVPMTQLAAGSAIDGFEVPVISGAGVSEKHSRHRSPWFRLSTTAGCPRSYHATSE